MALKTLLQKVDDKLSATLRRPRIRFVEKGGTQVARDVGKPNPWASDFYCSRKDCQVCSGRSQIEAEKEEAALIMVCKEEGKVPKPIKK